MEKEDYHREFLYPSDKYSNFNSLISMKRHFRYNLCINILGKDAAKYDILLNDMLIFIKIINMGYKWLSDEKYKKLYIYNNNGKITINRSLADDIEARLSYITIKLYPNVCTDMNGDDVEGISMLINGIDTIHITSMNYMGLLYILKTLDLFTAAQNLVNYHGRPQYGENMYSFDNTNIYDEQDSFVNVPNVKREPLHKQAKNKFNYFDK